MPIPNNKTFLRGTNKLKIGFCALVIIMFYISCFDKSKQLSMEEQYNEFVTLGNKDSLQVSLISNLNNLGLKDGESKPIKTKHLLGFDFKKLYLVDRMVIDYSIPCPYLKGSTELSDKDFCQFGIIYKNDGSIVYIRGTCDYDLMNLSRSFDKTGFSVNNPIEIVYPDDEVTITYSLTNRAPYLIEPLHHRKVDVPCYR